MALFGAPIAHEDHAQRACHAALAIQKAMADYGDRVLKDFGVDFRMRIGLNSGPVIVGRIGDDLRMDYTAVGDTTNLASRMESLAKPATILLSHGTHRLVKDYFEFQPLGTVEIRGKEEPQEAYELIKAGEVATRIGASVAKGLTRFVGRKNSMAGLLEAWEKAHSGSGQVVGIVGEAGVGKSRLLLEFRNGLPQEQFTYLEGRCIHFGGAMPYLPFLDILRSFFGIVEGEREVPIRKRITERVLQLDEKLRSILPPVQDLLSLKVEDEEYLKLEPKLKKERTFEALRDLLIRLSQERPLILAVEDLHWIDKTSEEFLDYLIGWLASARILLILPHRPEYTHQWGSKSYFHRIGLDQLTLTSSAELVQAILEGGEVSPELKDLILNRAAGNPLFMEELTHSLLENGSIERRDHQFVLSRRPSDLQVPDTIQGIISARMDRLEENLKRIMQVASVIGREFAFRILQSISGMAEDLKTSLLNLQGLEFIYEKSLFPELEYIFKHALTQEVAYNSLLLKRRKEIHGRIGQAIETIYLDRLPEFYGMIGYHYARSENVDKALHFLKLAGDKAREGYANREAIRFYRNALQVSAGEEETEARKRTRVQIVMGFLTPAAFLGYPEGSLGVLQEGERLAKELGDERTLPILYSRLGHYHTVKGNPILGLSYGEKCFDEACKAQTVELMASIAVDLCLGYLVRGTILRTIQIAPQVIDALEKTHREKESFGARYNVYVGLHGFYGQALGYVGRFKEAKAAFEKGRQACVDIGCKVPFGVQAAHAAFLEGDADRTVANAQEGVRIWEETQDPYSLCQSLWNLASGWWLKGDFREAMDCAERSLKIGAETGAPWVKGPALWTVGLAQCGLGDIERANRSMEECLKVSREAGSPTVEAMALAYLGWVLAKMETSDRGMAEGYTRQGIKIWEGLGMRSLVALGYLLLGEIQVETGERDEARQNLKKAEDMYLEMEVCPESVWLRRAQEGLARLGT
jgi:tetratricopeptide (TPR) repeat protein